MTAGTATTAAATQRLRSTRDVRAVFAARRAAASPLVVVHARSRGDGGPARITVVAGRTVGNAVARNRVKRRLRAVTRTLSLPAGVDVVVVGRPAALRAAAAELQGAVARQAQAVAGA